jgi:hypothetical protein
MTVETLMKRLVTVIVLVSLWASTANAGWAWYRGNITRIYLNTDGFVLTFDSGALDDCMHKYVYFRNSQLGSEQVNRAYSMALAAKAAGRPVGTVIDKAINGPGGVCNSNGSMDIKD